MQRALGLVRVSTPSQADGHSLFVQQNEICSYASRNRIIVEKILHINGAAYTQFANILQQVKNSMIEMNVPDHFIVYSVDRFIRSTDSAVFEFIEAMLKSGIVLHFIVDGLIINLHSDDATYSRLESLIREAEQESKRLSSRIKSVINFKRSNGMYYGGKVPHGLYRDDEGMMKINWNEMLINIFVDECRKPGNRINKLNEILSKISPYDVAAEPLEFDDDTEILREPLGWANIVLILKDYDVCDYSAEKIKKFKNLQTLVDYYNLPEEEALVFDFSSSLFI